MRNSKRTTRGVAEPVIVNDTTIVENSTDDVAHWRCVLATFLGDASSSLGKKYFYLLQSIGWKSLCLLTGLSIEVYSTLLLACTLIRVRRNRDGSTTILVERDQWNMCLVNHQLREDAYGRGGCCQLSDGRINKSAISGGGRTNKRDLIKMSLLRVGKVPSGEIPPSNTAINNGLELP